MRVIREMGRLALRHGMLWKILRRKISRAIRNRLLIFDRQWGIFSAQFGMEWSQDDQKRAVPHRSRPFIVWCQNVHQNTCIFRGKNRPRFFVFYLYSRPLHKTRPMTRNCPLFWIYGLRKLFAERFRSSQVQVWNESRNLIRVLTIYKSYS